MNLTKPASVAATKVFLETARDSKELRDTLREHIATASEIRETSFDESYIEFLDERIRLTPRGDAEKKKLMKRRSAFAPFCDVTLVLGNFFAGETEFEVRVHPTTRRVVHWDVLESWAAVKKKIKEGVLVNVLLHDSFMLGARFSGFSYHELGHRSERYRVGLESPNGARVRLPSKTIRLMKPVEHAS